jgi:cell division protein FtsN
MPRRETGEFEVLLGNKQLLSVFFIVVILLGVFFTMGYIVGRKSVPVETSVAASAKAPEPVGRPQQSDQQGGQSAEKEKLQFETPPAVPAPAAPLESDAPPNIEAAAVSEPAPGQTFLQVAAVKRPEAELVADVLKSKGFPSLIAPHPTEPIYRVLVGPLRDADSFTKTRLALEAAGFKPIVRKY